MTKLLLVTSSLFGDQSKSAQVAGEFVDAWRRTHPARPVVERALTPDAIPHLSLDALGALMTPTEQRSAEQNAAVAFADGLIEELEAADTSCLPCRCIISRSPRRSRRGSTTSRAPAARSATPPRVRKVCSKARRCSLSPAAGGFYSNDSPAKVLDFQEPYLRGVRVPRPHRRDLHPCRGPQGKPRNGRAGNRPRPRDDRRDRRYPASDGGVAAASTLGRSNEKIPLNA